MAEGVGQVDCGSTPDLVRDALREKHRIIWEFGNYNLILLNLLAIIWPPELDCGSTPLPQYW